MSLAPSFANQKELVCKTDTDFLLVKELWFYLDCKLFPLRRKNILLQYSSWETFFNIKEWDAWQLNKVNCVEQGVEQGISCGTLSASSAFLDVTGSGREIDSSWSFRSFKPQTPHLSVFWQGKQ